jgi:flagellar basal body-associated protein FliL
MESYWIYLIISIVVVVIAIGIIWYLFYRNQSKQLRKEFFEGEAYCIVYEQIKESSSVLGKRKT